jgi:DUF1016 N-terminal domain
MLNRVTTLIDEARRVSARTVNALITATYWSIGRHIVEFEQAGKSKAKYGEEVIDATRVRFDCTLWARLHAKQSVHSSTKLQ